MHHENPPPPIATVTAPHGVEMPAVSLYTVEEAKRRARRNARARKQRYQNNAAIRWRKRDFWPTTLLAQAEQICDAVCIEHGILPVMLGGPQRNRCFTKARFAAAIALRAAGFTYPQIGAFMRRSHWWAMWAVEQQQGGKRESHPGQETAGTCVPAKREG